MTVYSKIPEIPISNIYDLNIWGKELSYCKLIKRFFDCTCIRNRDTLYAYLRSHLESSIKKEFVESLISSFKNEELIKITNNNVELTDKFPIYMKLINKSIKRFQKKRYDSMNEYFIPHKPIEEVSGDVPE